MTDVNLSNHIVVSGTTTGINVVDDSLTTILSNADSSSIIIKINFLLISNTTTTDVTATVGYYDDATPGSGTEYPIINEVSIPANASFMIIDRPSYIYLPENTSLGITSGDGSGHLTVICSYETLS